MSALTISIIALAIFLLLMCLGMPIAFAFALVGAVGIILVKNLGPGLSLLGEAPFTWAANSSLLPLPLFVLMGQFVFYSGISSDLYDIGHKWVGKFRGGLAIATELASTAFGACCGLSLAASATMGTVAYPEMKKYEYKPSLACGSIAAGGSLSTLIPPSAPLIVYGFLTEQSISQLFIAGLLPGFILSALYIGVIVFMCWRKPEIAGRLSADYSLGEKLKSLKGIAGVLVLFFLVLGGLFFGIFTPSEAGTIGAFGALIIFITKRQLTKDKLFASLKETVVNTSFVLTIAIGAMIFTNFLTVSGFSSMFTGWIEGLDLSPNLIMICILLIYIPLGCVMDALSMILLTIPIVFPIVISLGFDPIWFGIVQVLIAEMALITPPVGMNSYIVQGVTQVPLQEVFRGILPFFYMMVLCVAILYIFPEIVTFLPSVMQ